MAFDQAPPVQTANPAERLALVRSLARRGFPVRAEAIACDLHDAALRQDDALLAAESADCIAYASMMTAQYEQGIRYGRLARAAWQARGRTIDEAAITGVLALLLAWIGEEDAVTEAEAALSLAERSGDAATTVWALQAKCLGSVLLKQPQRGLPYGERAVALTRQQAAPTSWAFLGLAEAVIWCCLNTEDGADAGSPALRVAVARAIALTREGLVAARRQGDGWLERLFINNVAEYSLYIGDTATADAALAEFGDAAGEPTSRCRATNLLMQGRSLAARERHEEALQAFLASNALTTSNDLEIASMAQSDLSDTSARLGRFDAALVAHRAFHRLFVRRASEAAERRARLYSLTWEPEELRATAIQAQAEALHLAASNEQLSREAERLLRASLEDPLTGLANRRRLEVAFLDLVATREPFVLAMLDVDRFKQVNDRFSHQVGDRVLRRLGEVLGAGIRSQDLVARYGGEEFALLLRGADAQLACNICERLRQAVAAHAWETLAPGLAVTVSIGLATCFEAASHEQVLALADRRLYAAKQGGRNLVVAAA
jgi:diguanylate cyclase (GGDEF)-like protein